MKIREIRLENYRSFEDCSIQFEDYYTAICGKNNSGKSNVIKAILNLLDRNSYRRNRFDYNSDYPIWKGKDNKEDIQVSIKLLLKKEADFGLLKFICFFLSDSKEESTEDIKDTELEISYRYGQDNSTEIVFDGKKIDDRYKISEITRRLLSSGAISFHNSTIQEYRPFKRGGHGYLENINPKTKESIDTKIQQVNKELSKILLKHKQDLQSIIGKLQDKYEVGLSFSGIDIDFDRIPYEISLGERGYELSLDDWGSGTKNRTLILNSIFEAKKQIEIEDESSRVTPIVIIEEPESFYIHLLKLNSVEYYRI